MLSEAPGRLATRPVDQLHRHVHERHAVGYGVMHAEDHRRTAVVFLDDVHGPEGMVGIERVGGEFADEALERDACRRVRAVECAGYGG